MPEVGAAASAARFYAGHAVTLVGVFFNPARLGWLREAGPAGARLKFGGRVEQLSATAGAVVLARLLRLPVLAGEGALGSRLAHDVVLLGRQLGTPLGIGLGDFLLGFCHNEVLPNL